jgi:ankyrin repeat protein
LCADGDPEQIKAGASLKEQSSDGFTPLLMAAYYNTNPEMVAFLLKKRNRSLKAIKWA